MGLLKFLVFAIFSFFVSVFFFMMTPSCGILGVARPRI